MKYLEARDLLTKAINKQQSIRTVKLAEILQSMNISLKNEEGAPSSEVHMLRTELRKKSKELKELNKKYNRVVRQLKGFGCKEPEGEDKSASKVLHK